MHKLITNCRLAQLIIIYIACLAATPCVLAQQFEFPASAVEDPATLPKAMPGLARAVIAAYREDNRGKYLDTLFRLQTVADQYADANKTLAQLRALPANSISPQPGATLVLYDVLARAKARQSRDGAGFDEALRRSFRETFASLDDRTSALAMRALTLVDQSALRRELHDDLEQQKGKSVISLTDALNLIRAYQVEEAYRSLAPLAPELVAEDDRRRYIIDRDVPVRTPD